MARVRAMRPLVHHLTNYVTMQFVASATRAIGALPVMAMSSADALAMVDHAHALVLNLGTPTDDRLDAMLAAGTRAAARRIPIVLDPVGAGATAVRTALAERLLREIQVDVVRANHGEAAALVGRPGHVRGVEARSDGHTDGQALTLALARQHRCVAAVTGPVDYVAGEAGAVAVSNGHPWLQAVTGAGCVSTAMVGAFCAVFDDRFIAAAAALACFGVAAEIAAKQSTGPGTLVPALLDALHVMTPDEASRAANIEDS
jgi:hydroxyethylthiazole kinase